MEDVAGGEGWPWSSEEGSQIGRESSGVMLNVEYEYEWMKFDGEAQQASLHSGNDIEEESKKLRSTETRIRAVQSRRE